MSPDRPTGRPTSRNPGGLTFIPRSCTTHVSVRRLPWDDLPRVPLAPLPSPLVHAPRFSAAIGAEVWIKRDDIGSLTHAGNKIRKLEFLLGQALADGVNLVVTIGAQQSNSVRAAAAACAQLGIRCSAIVTGERPPWITANLLLEHLVGAEIRYLGSHDWRTLEAAMRTAVTEFERAGHRVLGLPVGGSMPLGAVGFAAAYVELVDQLDSYGVDAELLVHASCTGGTQAGLEVGRRLLGRGPRVVGIGVAKGLGDVASFARLATEASAILGAPISWAEDEFDLDQGFMGSAYGVPTPEALEAIDLLARSEGIIVDPVYSGKGLAGLIGRVRDDAVEGPVVFWHTGGAQVVFEPELSKTLLGQGGGLEEVGSRSSVDLL